MYGAHGTNLSVFESYSKSVITGCKSFSFIKSPYSQLEGNEVLGNNTVISPIFVTSLFLTIAYMDSPFNYYTYKSANAYPP